MKRLRVMALVCASSQSIPATAELKVVHLLTPVALSSQEVPAL